ncbi:MAG: 23S rRNA (uracil(1939)-C(5))-methyltransferase RlmD [Deltaproteobacteria bacterium]|nr:23S rRNA (uracil(1939)-C(5))-methyltransferase RlmD [Deltaproteobacteria bacterium]
MTVRKGDIVELEITKMAYGGKGIGRVGQFVVFVRGAVPGDRVFARVYKKKRGYAEAAIEEILEASPDRVTPMCTYFNYCGGCQLQNVAYDAQLRYKGEQVKEAIKRIGGLDIPVHTVIASDDIFAYRNKMEFSFSDRRWFMPEEVAVRDHDSAGICPCGGDRFNAVRKATGGFALGFHIPGSFKNVIDIDQCLLQQDRGNSILVAVKRFAKTSHIPVYNLKTHEGVWRFLGIRYSTAFDQFMVNIVTSRSISDTASVLIDMISDVAGDADVTVVNNITGKKAAVAIGEQEIILKGRGFIEDKIGPFIFQVSANSFFQTNTRAAEKLYYKVMEYAELTGDEIVFDLYSGTGTIPIFLSHMAEKIIGFEISTSAVLNAQENCAANSVKNCRFVLGDIREELSNVKVVPDVIIIDPPRAGMHKDVVKRILALAVERVVYVSCNPTSLARDLAMMADKYDILDVQPIDMFPHTYHIETVVRLRRKKN